jgi:hypothetical protein
MEQEETGYGVFRFLGYLRLLLVPPAMAGGSDRLKSIDDENCPFNI